MKKTVWIIGGGGVVGEALKAHPTLLNQYDVRFTNRSEVDVLKSNQSLPFSEGDILVDLAPPPFVTQTENINPETYHATYTTPHSHFIRQAFASGISKYLFVSSGGAIYGRKEDKKPTTETDSTNPVSLYGISKLMQEKSLIEASKEFNRSYVILRPANVFNGLVKGQKHTGLIGVLNNKFKNHTPIEIFGDLEISKDYVSNVDVSNAITASLSETIEGIFNIGSGKVTSIKEILNAFEKSFGTKVEVVLKPFNSQDVKWVSLDISKAQRILNFKPEVSVLDWILANTNPQSL